MNWLMAHHDTARHSRMDLPVEGEPCLQLALQQFLVERQVHYRVAAHSPALAGGAGGSMARFAAWFFCNAQAARLFFCKN